MSFSKLVTIIQVSDNEDYDPSFGQLPTPAVETTESFLVRRDNIPLPADGSIGAGVNLGVPSTATRVLVHNHGTVDIAVGYSSTTIFKLSPGCTTQWQVPAAFDPSTLVAYCLDATTAGVALSMAWE
jgi:hypothetical protein